MKDEKIEADSHELDNIGDNIYKYRAVLELKQKELADKAGISKGSVSAYERSAVIPGIEAIEKIAKALNVTVDHILSDTRIDDNKSIKLKEIKALLLEMTPEQQHDFREMVSYIEGKYGSNND